MIDYFKRLGITAIELLPVMHFVSEPRFLRLGLTNYWGYNPLTLWCPDPCYEVDPDKILDIVLNHSAEVDLDGPTFSLRGIGNRSYYRLKDDGDYENWTGCGNTHNLSHPDVVCYALACLRYWVETCHVDRFRFDLATVMGRTPHFSPDAPLFDAMQRNAARCCQR